MIDLTFEELAKSDFIGIDGIEFVKVVKCKDCKHMGNSEKCVLSAISKEKDFPLFMLDNRGDWFCADGKRKDS